jgi:MoaA/NifB/PqqE/SkfB family radical SAM enzyme
MKTYQNISCVAPFSSLHISHKSYACCVINPDTGKAVDQTKSLDWNFNNTNTKLREEFIGWGSDFKKYKDCHLCTSKMDESQNLNHNHRASEDIDYIKNPTLTYLHIKFSNKCNLACRTCDPVHSSMLYKEGNLEENYPEFKNLHQDGLYQNISRDSELFKSILDNLHNIKHLWFSGGEPFLHEEVWEILDIMYERDLIKDLTLQVNTNGTVKLNQRRYDILNACKRSEIHISMDGIGKYAEYIRTGVVWDRWIENLKEYKSNIKFDNVFITATISVFNVHILDQIVELFDKQENLNLISNMVFSPSALSVINMNQQAKDYLNEKYKDNTNNKIKSLLYFINENKNTLDPSKVVEFIDNLDDKVIKNSYHRNYIPFREVDPEWYAILKG